MSDWETLNPSSPSAGGGWEDLSPPKPAEKKTKPVDDERAYLEEVAGHPLNTAFGLLETGVQGVVNLGESAIAGAASVGAGMTGYDPIAVKEAAERTMQPLTEEAAPQTKVGKDISGGVSKIFNYALSLAGDTVYSETMKVAPHLAPAAGAGTEALITLGTIVSPMKLFKGGKAVELAPDLEAIKQYKEGLEKPPVKDTSPIPYEKVPVGELKLEPKVTIPDVAPQGMDFLEFHADWVSRHLQEEIKTRDIDQAWEEYKASNPPAHYEKGTFNQLEQAFQKAEEEQKTAPKRKQEKVSSAFFKETERRKQALKKQEEAPKVRVLHHRDGSASVYFNGKLLQTGQRKNIYQTAHGLQRSTGATLTNVLPNGKEFEHPVSLGQVMNRQGGFLRLPEKDEPVQYKEFTTPRGTKVKFGLFHDNETGDWKVEPPVESKYESEMNLPYETNPITDQVMGKSLEEAERELRDRVEKDDPMIMPFASKGPFIPWRQRGSWTPFAKVSPKEKYVEKAVKALGEDYRKAAEQFWESANENFNTQPKVTPHATVGQQVTELMSGLFKLDSQRKADRILAKQYLQNLTPREFEVLSSDRLYNSMPEEGGEVLTPEEREMKENFLNPLVKEADDLYRKTLEVGGKEAQELNPHNIRTVKSSWLNRLRAWADVNTELGATGFGREAGTQKSRTMFALQKPDGTRTVINYDGYTIRGYQNKEPIVLGRDSGKSLGDFLEVGGSSVGKLVQATTKEIEDATNLQYNKNALANYLSSIAEMKAYIREKQFLKETISTLKDNGFAVSREKVPAIPHGFTLLHGDSTLDKYYIQDRFAEAFQDTLLRNMSPHSALERMNSMAVGSMFWNPFPHIFNAFDHYIATIGWDWFNPKEWGTIAKSMTDAWRDVSKLTPDYIKYMQSGMGLQYGRVVSLGAYEAMIKGIPESSWKSIAKDWGYGTHPEKMIADIYKGARHTLWGGSDVLMLSAYKFMSSKKGLDIFDKSLKNYIEAHNPNYQIPPRIGFDAMMKIPGMPEAVAKAISRNFSKMMQSRLFNVFGRYHYGQMKSLGHDLHDLVKQNEHSIQTQKQALSHLSFVMFNVAVVYPYLWDTMAKWMSGDPNAIQRRSGASTIPYTLWHLLLGDKKVNDLLKEAWSLPPATQLIIEVAQNRNLFTGQHIWEPQDNPLGQAEDLSIYGAGKLVAPLGQAESVLSGRLTPQQALSQSLSIQTEKKSAWRLRQERKEKIQALKRDLRRKQRYGL